MQGYYNLEIWTRDTTHYPISSHIRFIQYRSVLEMPIPAVRRHRIALHAASAVDCGHNPFLERHCKAQVIGAIAKSFDNIRCLSARWHDVIFCNRSMPS